MSARNFRRTAALAPLLLMAGCQLLPSPQEIAEPEVVVPPAPVVHAPVASHRFQFDPATTQVVGELQRTKVSAEDTLSDVARRFNLGYQDVVRANPGVDPWLPGEGTEVVLPTRFVLPDVPYEGIVINLAAMRIYYFPKREEGELQTVITHPIGIGRVGWETPLGVTKVTTKRKDPTWTPPASVRAEYKKNGELLPARVPPGADNPLGAFAMNLGWPSYLIHGTNKPYGVGMRVSAGCIRLYPEDIARLFQDVATGTKVTVVNDPILFGWEGDALHMQVFPILVDDKRSEGEGPRKLLDEVLAKRVEKRALERGVAVDLERIHELAAAPQGLSVPVLQSGPAVEALLADARRVENVLPEGANWDGKKELRVSAAEFEALMAEEAEPAPVATTSSVPVPAAGGATP